MSVAVGTSLLVIGMKSFAGLAATSPRCTSNGGVVLGVTAAAVVGSLIGGRLAGRVPEAALRKAFALALAAGACLSFVRSCPLRRVITA